MSKEMNRFGYVLGSAALGLVLLPRAPHAAPLIAHDSTTRTVEVGAGADPATLSVNGTMLLNGSALSVPSADPIGLPAMGTDMTTALMARSGLFTAHADDCAEGEAFFQIATENETAIGYCIEKEERSAASWTTARATCRLAGKRLPEPAEFHEACANPPSGLDDMTGNFEWASNFPQPMFYTTGSVGSGVAILGDVTCATGAYGWAYHNTQSPETRAYRCVR